MFVEDLFCTCVTWYWSVDFHFHRGCGLDPGYMMRLGRGGNGGRGRVPMTVFIAAANRTVLGRNSSSLHHNFRLHNNFVRGILTGFLGDGGKGHVRGNPRVWMAPTSSGA